MKIKKCVLYLVVIMIFSTSQVRSFGAISFYELRGSIPLPGAC